MLGGRKDSVGKRVCAPDGTAAMTFVHSVAKAEPAQMILIRSWPEVSDSRVCEIRESCGKSAEELSPKSFHCSRGPKKPLIVATD